VSRHVIDASALLAILNQESGAEQWTDAVVDGVMSAVNLSEVIARLADAAMPEEDIRKVIEPLDLEARHGSLSVWACRSSCSVCNSVSAEPIHPYGMHRWIVDGCYNRFTRRREEAFRGDQP